MPVLPTRHVTHVFHMRLRPLMFVNACCIGLIVPTRLILFGKTCGLFVQYLAELSLLEADPFLKYLPSQTAAAAYCLANYTVNRTFWVRTTAC